MNESDNILIRLKKARNPKERSENLEDFLCGLKNLKADFNGRRGEPINFCREPGRGSDGELEFRNRLLWLRTIPLPNDTSFIVLHSESGVYQIDKKGRCSSDLLGLFRSRDTTQFAIAELKYGVQGDHLLYAIAEGLRNVCLHFQGFRRIREGWKVNGKAAQNAWGKTNPFSEISSKSIHLLIIGDSHWARKQQDLFRYVPQSPIVLGKNFPKVTITMYSSKERAKAKSKPHALLPFKKIP